jgi:hypothetical protein
MSKADKLLWEKFLILFGANTIISVLLAFLFYYFFGKEIRLTGQHLEIDFFNTVCGVFTIIGLGIAIYQIAALRKEEEIIAQTSKAFAIKHFKQMSIAPVKEVLEYLSELQGLVNDGEYSELTLVDFIDKINHCVNIISNIDNQQISLNYGNIIDCEKCLTLLKELEEEFSRILDGNLYGDFRRRLSNEKVSDIIASVQKCDAELKKI